MSYTRETTLTFFIKYLSPLTSEVYLLVNLFILSNMLPLFFNGLLLYLVGRRTRRRVACKRQLSLSSLCTYLPRSRNRP